MVCSSPVKCANSTEEANTWQDKNPASLNRNPPSGRDAEQCKAVQDDPGSRPCRKINLRAKEISKVLETKNVGNVEVPHSLELIQGFRVNIRVKLSKARKSVLTFTRWGLIFVSCSQAFLRHL